MTRVFDGERTFLSPILRPVEIAIYKIAGVDERHEQHAVTYTVAMLLFHVGGFLILYALMRLQAGLPFNPAEQSAVAEDLSFNTAMSFITNTNWQNYGGESTMSYLVQMLGLTHQNFLSAATGIVLAIALIRGFARALDAHRRQFLGRYHPLHALRPDPASACPMRCSWSGRASRRHLARMSMRRQLEGAKQTIAVGPVASQIAIKMLGTNGGGFFNANAAHPFENPTALSNYRADDLDLCARRCADQRLRPHGRQPAAGLGRARRHGRPLHRRRHRLLRGRGARQRRAQRARTDRRQHGGQGSPLRHRRLGPVRRHHHRRLVRRRECHARFAYRARRHDPAHQHRARRDHRRRRRLRHVRDAALRHHLDLRRRPDGRPHARIRRQRRSRPRKSRWRCSPS